MVNASIYIHNEVGHHTKRIDHTIALIADTRQPTDPFPTITESTMTFYFVGTVESRREKVPCMPRIGQLSTTARGLIYGDRRTDSARRPRCFIFRKAISKDRYQIDIPFLQEKISNSHRYIFRARPETINKLFAIHEDLVVDVVCTFHTIG